MSSPLKTSTFTEFLRSFTLSWFTLMSGPISVPAAIFAVFYFEPLWVKIVFGATAVICFFVTSYLIWNREHGRASSLQEELNKLKDPGFDVEFKYEEESFYHRGTSKTPDGEIFQFELYRIAIKNHHTPQDIKVHILAIEGSKEFEGALPLPLRFQHDATAKVRSMKMMADERVFVDVVMQSALTTKGFIRTIQHTVNGFQNKISADNFKLKIAVIGERLTIEKWFLVTLVVDKKLERILKMELLPDHEATRS